jgi:glutamate N-acetyltransferase/amino-acid N-acetyltransferase
LEDELTNQFEFVTGGSITTPAGFEAGAASCGIKTSGLDLCVIASETPCKVGGVFTTNKVKAAPLLLSQQRLARGSVQAIVVNSGNANSCTGERGHADALETTDWVAEKFGFDVEKVLVASTGVIGVHLPMDKIRAGLGSINLIDDGGADAARAIMTTDVHPKMAAVRYGQAGQTISIGGISKGAGMIHPNLATMLSFVATDAALSPGFAQNAIARAADDSFNLVSVDGDNSTNDSLILMANGGANNAPIVEGTQAADDFERALTAVCVELAKAIARDGEGATRLIEVRVSGALSASDAKLAARTVVSSSLVKAAVHGSDPNWGRIICAVGYSGAEVDQGRVDISVGNIPLMVDGEIEKFDPVDASAQLAGPDVSIGVNLHLGEAEALAWGCDLSEEYVHINADYTT